MVNDLDCDLCSKKAILDFVAAEGIRVSQTYLVIHCIDSVHCTPNFVKCFVTLLSLLFNRDFVQ